MVGIKTANNWPMHWVDLRVELGIKRGAHLPDDGVPPREIQGFKVWVEPKPREPGPKRGSRKHRARAECLQCGFQMSAGRTNQHKCDALKRVVKVQLPLPIGTVYKMGVKK